MAKHGEEARDALVRQWQAITAAVATIDLETPSRVAGWRNREVVAHLCLQPTLLRKFIATAPTQHAVVTPPGEDEIAARMRAEGLSPHGWGNGPGDTYGWHEHGYEKVLYCVRGRIVFHTAGCDIELGPGDKMVLPPHTAHAATVGAEGVRCIEAPARETRAG